MGKKTAIVNHDICTACGFCMKVCPRSAVSVYRGCYAVVQEKECIGCGLCAGTCPSGCIELAERKEAP